jgi:hypothetical protein
MTAEETTRITIGGVEMEISLADYRRLPLPNTTPVVTVTDINTHTQYKVCRVACNVADCLCSLGIKA